MQTLQFDKTSLVAALRQRCDAIGWDLIKTVREFPVPHHDEGIDWLLPKIRYDAGRMNELSYVANYIEGLEEKKETTMNDIIREQIK